MHIFNESQGTASFLDCDPKVISPYRPLPPTLNVIAVPKYVLVDWKMDNSKKGLSKTI